MVSPLILWVEVKESALVLEMEVMEVGVPRFVILHQIVWGLVVEEVQFRVLLEILLQLVLLILIVIVMIIIILIQQIGGGGGGGRCLISNSSCSIPSCTPYINGGGSSDHYYVHLYYCYYYILINHINILIIIIGGGGGSSGLSWGSVADGTGGSQTSGIDIISTILSIQLVFHCH